MAFFIDEIAGIPGATVHVENSKTGIMTDVESNFYLWINAGQKAQGKLPISATGFSENKVALNTFTDRTIVTLALSQSIMGEVSFVSKPSFWVPHHQACPQAALSSFHCVLIPDT